MVHFRHPSPRENDDISVSVRKRGFWSPGRKGGIYYVHYAVRSPHLGCMSAFIYFAKERLTRLASFRKSL